MNSLDPVPRLGISPRWLRRESVIRAEEKVTPWPISDVIAYNSKDSDVYKSWAPPYMGYAGVGYRSLGMAIAFALRGAPWERAAIDALGYINFANKLDFFHFQFRILFPDHSRPKRMMNWEATPAPAVGANPGQAIEVVVPPGGVEMKSFNTY